MKVSIAMAAAFLMVTGATWAQIDVADSACTGTITGVVIDAETKEPLPGAVILVAETEYGSNTDIDGRFIIRNIPAGVYDIHSRMMGYNASIFKNVNIETGAVSKVLIKLKQERFGLENVVYLPRAHDVWFDNTSTRKELSESAIDKLPSLPLAETISLVSGSFTDEKSIEVSGETAFYLNQFDITDRQYGLLPKIFTPIVSREITLNTASFPAAEGHALSSIVRYEPRLTVGQDNYNLRWLTDGWSGERGDGRDWMYGRIGGEIGYGTNIYYALQGEIDKLSGERAGGGEKAYVVDTKASYLWADTLRYSQSIWVDTLGRWSGGWMDSTDAAWAREKCIREREGRRRGWKEQETWRLPHTDKASINLSCALKQKIFEYGIDIDIIGAYNKEQRSDYTASWKYNADQYYAHVDKSWLIGVKLTHQPTRNLFYDVAINKYRISNLTGVRDTAAEKERDWWEDYVFVPDIDLDGDSIFDGYEDNMYDYSSTDNPYGVPGIFVGRGMAGAWRKAKYEYTGFAGNFTWQTDVHNLLLAGVDIKSHQVYLREYTLPWYPYFLKDFYQMNPRTIGAYVQNRFEVIGFIFQPGVRWDYLDPNVKVKYDLFSLVDTPPRRPSKSQHCLSPRLGFAWPVSERTVYRANFGRYAQQPLFHQMYKNMDADWLSGMQVFGNPELKHQKATVYEAGFERKMGSYMNTYILSGTLYYKERKDLVGLAAFGSDWLGGDAIYYYQYQNNGQSTTRGLEFCLRKDRGKSGLSGEASYTFQNTSYSLNPATVMLWSQWHYYLGYNPLTGFPMENYQEDHPPDWDLRHKIVLITNYQTGEKVGPRIGGFQPFSSMNVCLVNLVKSGLPYTRIGYDGNVKGGLNQGRLPWSWNTDLKVEKRLKIWKAEGSLALEVLNLFDRKNISGVYPQSGSPDWLNPPLDRRAFGDSTIVDSLPGPVNAFGDTIYTPNPDYNMRRDLNGDGIIDAEEMYISYKAAWEDFISDSKNSWRRPWPKAYQPPRMIRFSLGAKF